MKVFRILDNLTDNLVVGDKTVLKWDEQWENKGILTNINLEALNGYFGVYRMILNGEIIYIGKASEYSKYSKRGFHKRLGDYMRDAGNSKSAKKIQDNKDKISIEIINVGSDKVSSIVADMLEAPFLVKYHPVWNIEGKKEC